MASSVAENTDPLTEILLCLPAKLLLRFKCVSKQWRTLISHHRFCHLHALRRYHTSYPFPSALLLAPVPSENPTFPVIHFTGSGNKQFTSRVYDFSFLDFPSITIKHSCKGLLFVEAKEWQRRDVNSIFFVCNLITKQFVPIFPPTITFTTTLDAIFLDLDPLRSSHFRVVSICFGDFSSSGDNFNLEIPKFRGDSKTKYEIKVYSSDTRSWSDPGFCFNVSKNMNIAAGVYCNGAIFWIIKAENSFYFDVENQCFKTYPMPSNFDKQKVWYFGESAGHLHIILGSFDNPTHLGFDILELKEDYSGWFVRFHVDLNPIRVAFPGLNFNDFESFDVSCIVCQEKEEDSMLVLFINGRLMSYNLGEYTFRKLGHFKHSCSGTLQVFQYFENLFWVRASKSLKRSRRNP